MINVAIVDDEDKCASRLRGHFEKYGNANGIAFHVDTFINGLNLLCNYSQQYDIIMLDIDMPHLNGLDAAHRIRKLDSRVALIFVTNLAQYAIKGYEVDALDFILKPIEYDVFEKKIKKALSRMRMHDEPFILVKTKAGQRKVALSEIFYVTVSGRFVTLHTRSGDVEAHISMKELEKRLINYDFVRNDNSSMVNLLYVTEVNGDGVTVHGTLIPCSRNRKKATLDAFTLYLR